MPKCFLFKFLFYLGLLTIICYSTATASAIHTEHMEAQLISETNTIQPGQPFWLALKMKPAEHWHTYWINAGDTGLATSIDWKLPTGFTAGPIQWPYPEKIEAEGITSYGFSRETLLLVQITPPTSLPLDFKINISATAKWLVCKEVCIPETAEFNITLPTGKQSPATSAETVKLFADARTKLPTSIPDWKLAAAIKNDLILVKLTKPSWFKENLDKVTFFPIQQGIIINGAQQQLTSLDDGYILEIKRNSSDELPTQLQGVLVANSGWRGPKSEEALEVNLVIEPITNLKINKLEPANHTTRYSLLELFLKLGAAFLGGLILNLMPCVLPVLSIKILGFVNQAAKEKSKIWKHGAAFTFGILLSFWVLAGSLLLLRAGGEQLGWGFQLQSPRFLVILATLMFAIGLNLFGVFEIGTSLTRAGGINIGHSGLSSSFFSGVLATIVATPCTAPFMGSALGFAITQSSTIALLIFTFLGLGMAAPYLIISSIPSLLKFIPKPDAWMETFKQLMGFPLMGTVIWIIWVLGIQTGITGIINLLICLVLIGMGTWILGKWGNFTNPLRARITAYLLMAILSGSGLVFALKNIEIVNTQPLTTSNEGIQWQEFSPERLDQLRTNGTPVFIDFTAAWCLSCQVNERIALNSPEVQAEFKRLGIVPMKADWTSRNEVITKKLAEFGRNGVPLYVIYGKNPQQQPTVLPEVITPGIVLDGLKNTIK